jgi:transcriptional regulator with XRE-family HTH domain
MLDGLRASQEYRNAFIEESICTRIAAQIRALRDARGWNYKQLAELINKKVSWVYRLEDPNATPPTIPTLLQVAAAFDIGLDVRFRSFSELLEDVTTLGAESFLVPSFEEEMSTDAFSRAKRRRKVRCTGRRRRTFFSLSGESGRSHIGMSKPQRLAQAR